MEDYMAKLDTLKKALDKAITSYENVKEEITVASERVNVAAQLFSMGEVEKDVLVSAIELRDTVKASKAEAWDKVVVAEVAYLKLKKSTERAEKVAALKAKLKELG